MIAALVPAIAGLIGKAIDKAVPDRDLAERLKADINSQVLAHAETELKGAIDIVLAEVKGDSWLQRNWRPLLMLVIVAIVANNYLLAPYLQLMFGVGMNLELPDALWQLMTLGVGGYIASRGAEKGLRIWKDKE